MKVLVVGSGGREHALAWKIAQSPLLDSLLIAPGNPGTAQIGTNVPVPAESVPLVVDIARREKVDLVVVGPEAPLAAGLADECAKHGIAVFGPSAAAARIESSKAFAKTIMQQAGVPTAEGHVFGSADEAIAFVRGQDRPWVVKADGLAGGKGVLVPSDIDSTIAAIGRLAGTAAGTQIVLEEILSGPEVSLIALCDGERLLPLVPAQDHKRLKDGDAGPNTGGMGAFAPTPTVPADDIPKLAEHLMLPVVKALANAGTPFRGALYAGLMLTEHGPKVLEFNARFGDPETQVLMPLIEGDLLPALYAAATGTLEPAMLGYNGTFAASVVMASDGYPEAPRRYDQISGIEAIDEPGVLVFHSGTAWENSHLVTNGGRVLSITGTARTLPMAVARAYEALDVVRFKGMQFRRDIGQSAAPTE